MPYHDEATVDTAIGNHYLIENISPNTEAELFFAQARKIKVSESDEAAMERAEGDQSQVQDTQGDDSRTEETPRPKVKKAKAKAKA